MHGDRSEFVFPWLYDNKLVVHCGVVMRYKQHAIVRLFIFAKKKGPCSEIWSVAKSAWITPKSCTYPQEEAVKEQSLWSQQRPLCCQSVVTDSNDAKLVWHSARGHALQLWKIVPELPRGCSPN